MVCNSGFNCLWTPLLYYLSFFLSLFFLLFSSISPLIVQVYNTSSSIFTFFIIKNWKYRYGTCWSFTGILSTYPCFFLLLFSTFILQKYQKLALVETVSLFPENHAFQNRYWYFECKAKNKSTSSSHYVITNPIANLKVSYQFIITVYN